MTTLRFISRRTVRAAVVAVLATIALPAQAFACWYTCTAKYGYRFSSGGEEYVLDSCYQTWPDGASGPITKCIYVS